MFCNMCGSSVGSEQSSCSQCGSSTTGIVAASAARKRVAEHFHLLAILWFVVGSFYVVPATAMGVLAATVGGPLFSQRADKLALIFAPGLFVSLGAAFLTMAALHFVAGWALLKVKGWGRSYALTVAFLALLFPPFDTALGVYSLFVLLPDAAGDEYRRLLQTAVISGATAAPGFAR